MKKLLIDCDPGIDDAFLLLLADCSPEVEVLGIVTVAGNVSGKQTFDNARRLSRYFRHSVPVYAGAQSSLTGTVRSAGEIHGAGGLGEAVLPEAEGIFETEFGVDAMIRILRESTDPVTILAVGPLTNIALLLDRDDCPREKIEAFSIMGGGLKGGNFSMCAEFNIIADVEAAYRVFHAGIPIYLSPLDVTERASITPEELTAISKKNAELANLLTQMCAGRMRVFEETFGTPLYCPNDVCALLVLLEPQIFQWESLHVTVVKEEGFAYGMTVCDRRIFSREEVNMKVAMDVDVAAFREVLVRRFS